MVPMPKPRRLGWGWTLLSLWFLSLVIFPKPLVAQQEEIPPASEDPSVESTRIVTHRPLFYTVKRVAHPVSWLEGGISPVLRLVERFSGNFAGEKEKTPPVSGVKFWAGGLGSSTGVGPLITPFHNNLFNAGIRLE